MTSAAFDVVRVHWAVTLSRGGELLSAEPLYTARRGPGPPRRPGPLIGYQFGVDLPGVPVVGPRNSGVTPGFLVDSLAWLFGYAPRGADATARLRYQLFRAQVLALGEASDDPGVAALCRYYRQRPQPEPDLFAGFEEADVTPCPSHRAYFAYVYQAGAPATPLHRVEAVVRYWRARRAASPGYGIGESCR